METKQLVQHNVFPMPILPQLAMTNPNYFLLDRLFFETFGFHVVPWKPKILNVHQPILKLLVSMGPHGNHTTHSTQPSRNAIITVTYCLNVFETYDLHVDQQTTRLEIGWLCEEGFRFHWSTFGFHVVPWKPKVSISALPILKLLVSMGPHENLTTHSTQPSCNAIIAVTCNDSMTRQLCCCRLCAACAAEVTFNEIMSNCFDSCCYLQ